MSRKEGALLIGLYFLAACAFGALIEFGEPFALAGKKYPILQTVAGSIGRAISLFLMAGIVPGIIWLIGLLRPPLNRSSYNRSALGLWPIFGLILGAAMFAGNRFDREEKIKAELSGTELLGEARNEMIRSAKLSCVEAQRKNPLNRQGGVTDQQINAYCDCTAAYLVKVITIDEMRYIARNGQHPESLTDKIAKSSLECSRAVLFRK